MNKYAKVAIRAVELVSKGEIPENAWDLASKNDGKSCPKCAFLGLAEEGFINNIPKGKYHLRKGEKLNKGYAINAVNELSLNPALAQDKNALWKKCLMGESKKENGQIDVVLGLFFSHNLTINS